MRRERKHLASWFVSNVSKNKLHELLDKDIITTDNKGVEVLHEVSELVVWCLSVRGEDRSTNNEASCREIAVCNKTPQQPAGARSS
jgi:hypothetical protein